MTERPVAGVPIEDLLSHAPWLRQVARTLVREPGVADDVLQETWLTALRSPPAEADNLRGWLGRTLQNLVRQRARSERSRSQRERTERGAGQEIPLSPEALVQGAEMQRLLAEEVMGLREPFRTTVLRRYYEGLEPSRIAELEGVPAGTVRWRLKRGLELLREQMDERAERDTWRMGLLALVGADVLGHGPGMLASSLLSPLSISSVPKAVLIVAGATAAAALLVVAGTLRSAEVETRPLPRPEVAALHAPAGDRTPLGPAATTAGRAKRPDTLPPGRVVASVTGRVLRLDPELPGGFVPAAGVRVAGAARALGSDGIPIESTASSHLARTDDRGGFELPIAHGRHGAALLLRALADDLHDAHEVAVHLPGTGEGCADVELLLVPHGSLVGQTVDAGGHSVDGVELFFAGGSVRSDQQGRFWLAGYGGQTLLAVERDGYEASAQARIARRDDGSWAPARVTLVEGTALARALPPSSRGGREASSTNPSEMLSSRWGTSARDAISMRSQRYLDGSTAGPSIPGPGPSRSTGVSFGRELSTTAESLRRAGTRFRSTQAFGSARTGFRRGGALFASADGPGEALRTALLLAEAQVHGAADARHAWCPLGQHAVAEQPEALFATPAAAPACRALVEELGRLLASALPPDPRSAPADARSESVDGSGRSTASSAATTGRTPQDPSEGPGSRPNLSGHADSPTALPQIGAVPVVGPAGVRANS